jgi:hypothetical protein
MRYSLRMKEIFANFCGSVILFYNFSIESVDINKIMVAFYHLFVHGFQLKK